MPALRPDHAALEAVDRLEDDFQRQLAEADATSDIAEERALVKTIRENFLSYGDLVQKRLTVGGADVRPEELARLSDAVADACKQLGDLNDRLLDAATTRRAGLAATYRSVRIGILVVGPAIGLVCGIWFARRFARSISRISITLNDVASELVQPLGRVELDQSGDLSRLQEQVQVVATRIREVMEELHDARQKAMAAARLAAAGELATGIAHELRNPLTSVKLLIQTAAQRHPDRPLSERQMQVVQDEIVRMETIIERLLDFARPSEIRRVRHDIRETVRRALNLVEGRAHQQKVTVEEQSPPEPVLVDADPEQLHQVFVNLLLNAIEAMAGGGTLHVSIEALARPGACRVEFADSGPGIPPALVDRIFDPFVTSKERGTGLGLAISRRIVQEHGGTIGGANRTDGGAVFTVVLPPSLAGSETGVAVQEAGFSQRRLAEVGS